MQLRVVAYALAFAAALCAQDRPQMTWEGEVDGTTILSIRGKRIEAQDKAGRPVRSERYHFNDKLPGLRRRVRLQVNQGRGFVRIVDQPRVENNYTLAVSIEDPQDGAGFYSIALYWDTADSEAASEGERLAWSGRVDEEAVVVCRARQCRSEPARGAPVIRERAKFSKPLPDREVEMRLENVEGRGEVRLLEQPHESNGYSARVLIRDPQTGAGDYSFTLRWTDNPRSRTASSSPGLTWSGRVGGTVRVAVQGGGALSETVAGGQVGSERAVFLRPLPAGSNMNLEVRKQRGRGAVEVVEYPSNSNGYRLVFEIRDPGPAADDYEIEVSW